MDRMVLSTVPPQVGFTSYYV